MNRMILGITTQELKGYLLERVYGHVPESEITR